MDFRMTRAEFWQAFNATSAAGTRRQRREACAGAWKAYKRKDWRGREHDEAGGPEGNSGVSKDGLRIFDARSGGGPDEGLVPVPNSRSQE